jgi:hypothetical protein
MLIQMGNGDRLSHGGVKKQMERTHGHRRGVAHDEGLMSRRDWGGGWQPSLT